MSKAIVEQQLERKSWCYDCECYTNFFSATFHHISSEERREFIIFSDPYDSRYDINDYNKLHHFIINEVRTLVGYNSIDYDDCLIKHLILSIDFMKSSKPREITKSCKVLSDKIINRQKARHQQEKVNKDQYLETLRSRKIFGSMDLLLQFNTINRVSLKQIAINLRWPEVIDLPHPPDHIVKRDEIFCTGSTKKGILYYNHNDTGITKALLANREEAINQRKEYGIQQNANVMNANDVNIAKYVLRKYYAEVTGKKIEDFTGPNARTFYRSIRLGDCISKKISFMTKPFQEAFNHFRNATINPNKLADEVGDLDTSGMYIDSFGKLKKKNKKKQFEFILNTKYTTHTLGLGGIHSNNESEIIDEDEEFELLDIDVKSYYPWIIINERIYPRHLGPAFLIVYEDYIVIPRMTLKEEGNEVGAEMLKKSANGTFGLTKSVYSWLYDPKMTIRITVSGQLYLMMLIERLEYYTNAVVVYSNTDGITVRVPRSEKDTVMSICKQWQEYAKFELEFVNFKRMIIKDVNNYMMIKHSKDPKKAIKTKGVFLEERPITAGYVYPVVAKALNAYYKDGTAPQEFIYNHTDIYDFMKAERTNIYKYDVTFRRLDNPDKEYHLAKNNRWIVTKKNPDEGKLTKFSFIRKEHVQMQKGRYVTIVNDMSAIKTSIKDYHLDYDFYMSEVLTIINQIKIRPKIKVKPLKQTTMFA